MKSFSNKTAISTSSLGLHPTHTLDLKIKAAANHGFHGIEIVHGDLQTYSSIHNLSMPTAASKIKNLCDSLNLEILSLCPFENFEGNPTPLSERLDTATQWLDIAKTLGATYMQVPAQFSTTASGDPNVIVADLRALSDLAAKSHICIAYEPMSWSLHHPTWQSTQQLCDLVDRENFGICMDSFHVATKLWGCATAASGKFDDTADTDLRTSLRDFVRDFPMRKLFYVQLSDGERFDPPFSEGHPWFVEGEAEEFSWSKHARPFPLETELGAYLPVVEIFRAWVVEKGFEGWVSLESFDRRMRVETFRPERAAERAEVSLERLEKAVLASSRANL